MKQLSRRSIGMAALLALVSGRAAWCEPVEAWVARYDGPGSNPQAYIEDVAYAIAVDSSGYVYVTGASVSDQGNSDFTTIKYNPVTGDTIWVAGYNGPGNGDDGGTAIVLDPAGNVYVTGSSGGDGTGYDYATVKYDPSGNQIWLARYNGLIGWGDDNAVGLVVDVGGNAWVTGTSYNWGRTSFDWATVKYDSLGNQVWVTRYDGPGNADDYAAGLALDPYGNAYVTGQSAGIGTYFDFATVKYDRDGNLVWVARYNGPGNKSDGACAVAVDADLNVYVTGTSDATGIYPFNDDYATIKYDPWGNQVWVVRYNGPMNNDDWAGDMTIDEAGNIYVTGASYASPIVNQDFTTIKYNTSGTQLWVATYPGPGTYEDWVDEIAVDRAGNVFVAGRSDGPEWERDYDYATVKYDSLGNQVWEARYDGPATGWDVFDEPHGLALDARGDIYVTGRSDGVGTYSDYLTVKYMPTVTVQLTCLTPGVPRPGRLRYEVTFTNNSADSQALQYWAKVKLPNGRWYQDYAVPPTAVSLLPHETRSYRVRQTVPRNAPLGAYEYWGYVGPDTSSVWNFNLFDFTVSGTSRVGGEDEEAVRSSAILFGADSVEGPLLAPKSMRW